jgi:hypothetical protein
MSRGSRRRMKVRTGSGLNDSLPTSPYLPFYVRAGCQAPKHIRATIRLTRHVACASRIAFHRERMLKRSRRRAGRPLPTAARAGGPSQNRLAAGVRITLFARRPWPLTRGRWSPEGSINPGLPFYSSRRDHQVPPHPEAVQRLDSASGRCGIFYLTVSMSRECEGTVTRQDCHTRSTRECNDHSPRRLTRVSARRSSARRRSSHSATTRPSPGAPAPPPPPSGCVCPCQSAPDTRG